MNKVTLRTIQIDYVHNKIDVMPTEYRYVIAKLVAEIERLQAVIDVNKLKVKNE